VFLKRKTVIALGVLIVTAQACGRQSSVPEPTLTHAVSPQPPRTGQSTFTLRLADASGKPLTGVRIELEGNMSHAGMTPVFAGATEIQPGQYSSTMELSMAGDWYFLVHMTLPDGRKLERQFEIKGVR
jgi:YtkA-like protein